MYIIVNVRHEKAALRKSVGQRKTRIQARRYGNSETMPCCVYTQCINMILFVARASCEQKVYGRLPVHIMSVYIMGPAAIHKFTNMHIILDGWR